MMAPQPMAAAEHAPLRTPEDWAAAVHRPVVLVGNGPSAFLVDRRRIPADAVVVRMNAFMFEPDYAFGDRVDGMFWAIGRRWLQVATAVASEMGSYRFGTFFAPPEVLVTGVAAFRDEQQWLRETFDPLRSHFDFLRAVPQLRPWFAARSERKFPGLPTQGMQALGALLVMGFRDIRIAGMDFYQSTTSRYAFPYPEIVRRMTAPVHLRPGYEDTHHSISLDLAFLRELQPLYTDAQISCLSEQSFLASFVPLTPYPSEWPMRRPDAAPGSDPVGLGATRLKDLAGFEAALSARLLAPYGAPRGLLGEVSRMRNGRALIWGWQPEEPDVRRKIRIDVPGQSARDCVADGHVYELDLSCVGDASHATVLPAADLMPAGAGALTHVRDLATGRVLEGGTISAYCFPLANKPVRSQVVLVGFGAMGAAEAAALAALPAGDTVIDLRDPAQRDLLDETAADTAVAGLSAQVGHEVACFARALTLHKDRVVRIAGFALFGRDRTDLLRLAQQDAATFRRLLQALRAGDAATLVPAPDAFTQQLEHLMKPVAIVVDHHPMLTPGFADTVSLAHALLRALPLAQRIDPSNWEIDSHARLRGLPERTLMLVDGETLANMPAGVFRQLVDAIRQKSLVVVVMVQSLETGWAGQGAIHSYAERLRRLADQRCRFHVADAHVGRLLAVMLDLPRDAVRVARQGPRWMPALVRAPLAGPVLAIVDDYSDAAMTDLQQYRETMMQAGASAFSLDITQDAGSNPDGFAHERGDGLRVGIALPSPDAVSGYSAVIVATEDVGSRLSHRLLAALGERCPPVIACGSSGLATRMPPDAVCADLRDALDRIAAGDCAAAVPPPAAVDPWPGCADILDQVMPGEKIAPWLVGALASARGGDVPEGMMAEEEVNLELAVLGLESDPERVLQVQVENRGGGWLDAASEGRGGTVLSLRIEAFDGSRDTELTASLPADLPPGAASYVDFRAPLRQDGGPTAVTVSVRQSLDKAVLASIRRVLVLS